MRNNVVSLIFVDIAKLDLFLATNLILLEVSFDNCQLLGEP